jgi:methionyl aminopeptidase
MIFYKDDDEIELIKEGAQILGKVHAEVAKNIKIGVTTKKLDAIAEEFIRDHGAVPSFKGYNGFPASLCMSPNSQVVHGFPTSEQLKNGDILSVDCGVYYKGYHSDSAYTYPIGEVSDEVKKLLKVTYECLYKGIENAKVNNRIGDISFAVQKHAEENGFSVVRELVGHGLGKRLHESPEVPNFGKAGSGPKINNGLVIAIEPMINLGKKAVVQERDGWTIRTADKLPSAHFEHTVAIKKEKTEILTTFKYIEEVLKING